MEMLSAVLIHLSAELSFLHFIVFGFSGKLYQMAWWVFAEHEGFTMGNFLLSPEIYCISFEIRYFLITRWIISIFA